jgi:hypothetical protein
MEPSTLFAATSAVVSVVAVLIAFRSSSAARASAETAATALQRAAIRELMVTCREAVFERRRIDSLAPELRSAQTAMFVLAGVHGGSAHTNTSAKLDSELADAQRHAVEAETLAADASSLLAASGPDIDQRSTRIGLALTELRTIRESIERRLSEANDERARLLSERKG